MPKASGVVVLASFASTVANIVTLNMTNGNVGGFFVCEVGEGQQIQIQPL